PRLARSASPELCYGPRRMSAQSQLKLGVLVSGTGSNLQAILDAIAARTLNAQVRVVISNKPAVPALERARAAGVPALTIPSRDFPSRAAFDSALATAL